MKKIICEIDESIASQHDPSSDVIFLGDHSESIFPFCLLLIAESISLDISGKSTVAFLLNITSRS